MKIVAISDLHGFTPEIPECDLLLIGGDIALQNGRKNQKREWRKFYLPWMEAVPARKIAFIGGNHDYLLADPLYVDWLLINLPNKATFLKDTATEFEGVKIYGSPWVPTYSTGGHTWVYMKEEMHLVPIFSHIPEDAGILLTHGPPYEILDIVPPKGPQGSVALANRLKQMPALPALHIFGHIHENGQGIKEFGGRVSANVAMKDAGFTTVKRICQFEFDTVRQEVTNATWSPTKQWVRFGD